MNRVYWITGLPDSGKTTLGRALMLAIDGPAKHLDGDETRKGLSADLGFSARDRAENIRRVGHLAKLFFDAGFSVVCSYISPYKAGRDMVRSLFPAGDFVEIYLNTPAEVCEQRDAKGLWAKARAGEIKDFTGVNDPYEPPENPKWTFDTTDGPIAIANTILHGPAVMTSFFVGRWCPLHASHVKLIRTALDAGNKVVIGIRDVPRNADNPYRVDERIQMLTDEFGNDKVEYVVIPEDSGGLEICHGRKVGWTVREIHLDDATEAVSATTIRAEAK